MKTYHQTIQSKLANYLVSLAVAVLWLAIIKLCLPALWLQKFFNAFILIGLFFSIPITLLFGESIKVSADGIEYNYFIFGEKVGWDGFNRTGRYLFREGLFIKQGYRVIPTVLSFYSNYTVYGGFLSYVFVPLSSFDKNWRNSELGEHIKQYAPHLFQ